jgi:site-specific DNA-methyltransferase (adenine-specific)
MLEDILDGKRWAVLHVPDSVAWLGSLEEASADCVIADPPYDKTTHKGARTSRRKRVVATEGVSQIAIDFPPADPSVLASLLVMAAKRWALAFCSLEQLGAYQAAAAGHYVRGGVWVKPNPSPQFTGDRPGQGAEGIAIMHRAGSKKWNGGGARGVWDNRTIKGTIHPNEKPIDLMLALVEAFTDPGDIVLDPFAGSGTTGAACIRLGRRFVGLDFDPKYVEAASARLRAEEAGADGRDMANKQTSIFDYVKGQDQ